jgi:predicted nucleic acid-binding protein
MEVNDPISRLAGKSVYLDTNCLIYLVEGHTRYRPALEPLIGAIAQGSILGITSELTVAEVLVKPIADRRPDAVMVYKQLLENGEPFSLIPISMAILELSATLRGTCPVKLADAIHLATAIDQGCAAFVTNDKGIRGLLSLNILYLDDLLP